MSVRELIGFLPLKKWYSLIDKPLLAIFAVLMLCGVLFSISYSPSAAVGMSLHYFHFVARHSVFGVLGLCIIISVSFMSRQRLLQFFLVLFIIFLLALIYTHVSLPIRGSRRWIRLLGFSVQPSEILKPLFAVVSGWLICVGKRPAYAGNIVMLAVVMLLIIKQPDIVMSMSFLFIWIAQAFLAGLSILMLAIFGVIIACILVYAYMYLPYVARRIDIFLSADVGYQVKKAISAIENAGLFGVGPGQGVIKHTLPDVHTDFVFAVIGEEYGVIAMFLVVLVFTWIIARIAFCVVYMCNSQDRIILVGLMVQIMYNVLVHVGTNIGLIPPTGITLPFLSYGGSSVLSISLCAGAILALLRCRNKV